MATTVLAPAARAAATQDSPIGPTPCTTTRSPCRTPPLASVHCTPLEIATVHSMPLAADMPSGRRCTRLPGARYMSGL